MVASTPMATITTVSMLLGGSLRPRHIPSVGSILEDIRAEETLVTVAKESGAVGVLPAGGGGTAESHVPPSHLQRPSYLLGEGDTESQVPTPET